MIIAESKTILSYQELPPGSVLQPYVRCIWTIAEDHTQADSRESATPDSYVELICNLGDPCYLQAETEIELPAIYLVGLQNKPIVFRVGGMTHIIGIRFYPWGVLPFKGLGLPVLNSTPQALAEDWQVLQPALRQIARSGTFEQAAHYIAQFLVSRLKREQPDLSQVAQAGGYLYATNGLARIDELAAYCSFSSRQLERQFKTLVGISPKKFARAVRFERIALRLFTAPDTDFLDLAYEFGYTDQAHFINDFKAFAHLTPGEFVKTLRAYAEISESK